MDNKDKPKKKRGRKPKKDIKKQENVENVITNNMIIKLNHITEEGTIVNHMLKNLVLYIKKIIVVQFVGIVVIVLKK